MKKTILRKLWHSFVDVAPILAVIIFFQVFIIQKPFPNLLENIMGMFLVVGGLFLFVIGLETALFPLGEKMATQFMDQGSVFWVVLFGFSLGFSTTIAEPALTVIARKAGEIAVQDGAITQAWEADFILGLRLTIAFSVGVAGALGVYRVLRGWSLVKLILAGYALIVAVTIHAPKEIIGIAYDAGGITTSTITVPLITALGVGLATSIRGRNPVVDGFGIIAMIFGIVVYGARGG
ncbi:MAG: DUF1538 family protein [Nitrospinaceae bacterium]